MIITTDAFMDSAAQGAKALSPKWAVRIRYLPSHPVEEELACTKFYLNITMCMVHAAIWTFFLYCVDQLTDLSRP